MGTEWLMTDFLFCFFFLLVIGIDVFTTHSTRAKAVGVSTADILELQIGAQAQSQVISFFIIGQSWQASLAVGCFPQPLQCVVSFERYHVVN